MKKLLTLSAALLAASLFFTACSNPAGGDSGGNSNPGPGSWSNTANWYSGTSGPVFKNSTNTVYCGTLVQDGQGGAVYTNTNPVETETGTNALSANQFTHQCYLMLQDFDTTGFEATAKCTSPYAAYGFKFNISNDWKNLYELFIQADAFLIKKRVNGVTTRLQNWTANSAINTEPGENKVTVFKDGNAIKIQINGTLVYTINNPESTSGSVGVICGMGYDDIQNHNSITSTYKITKLQR